MNTIKLNQARQTKVDTIEKLELPAEKLQWQPKAVDINPEKGTSLWADAMRRLMKNKMALFSAVYIIFVILVTLCAPWLASYSYEETDLILGATPPSFDHWLGTDDLGRDMLTRILFGARVSMMVGLIATVVSVVIGVTYGAVAGYVGGKIDAVMMRAVDVIYVLPYTILVILLMVLLGRNIYNLFIALGAIQWMVMARIVRGQVVSIKKMEYIEAARASGVKPLTIIFRHVIPNTLGPVIVFSTLTIPSVILEEAFLSFIGLGVQAPMSSWGTLISDGVTAMEIYPWMIIYPALTLVMTLFALNFLGDGLRDALDPKASKD
jgi:oligopeptide transport system permease protein